MAGRLNNALTRYVTQEGATIARLCTGSSNLASRRHLDKTGFKLSQRFQRLKADRPLGNPVRGVISPRKFNPQVWHWVTSRPEFEKSHHTFSDGWTWYPLDSKAFTRFVSQRGVICTGSAPISSCSLFSREEGHLTLGFTAGNPEEITLHGKYLLNAAAKGGDRVRALVPKGTRLVRALESAGFEKSGTILVYEKQLTSKVQKS